MYIRSVLIPIDDPHLGKLDRHSIRQPVLQSADPLTTGEFVSPDEGSQVVDDTVQDSLDLDKVESPGEISQLVDDTVQEFLHKVQPFVSPTSD
jgi:hypothetical protein